MLLSAQSLIRANDFRGAANRSYYAIFHAMRAVLALHGIDMKKHSGIMSEFRRLYIKTNILPEELSVILAEAFDVRTDCDYDDYYILSREEVEQQAERAVFFVKTVSAYLSDIIPQ